MMTFWRPALGVLHRAKPGAAAKGVEDVKAWAREHAGSVRDFPPAPAPSRTGKAAAGTATPDPAGK